MKEMLRYMALIHYVINHRLLVQMQKNRNVFCAICYQPIVEGQIVASRKATAVRHEECYQ
jgi:hypothetical protein